MTVSVYCSIPFLVAVGLLFAYEIDRRMEARIERELEQRRRVAAVSRQEARP